MRVIPNTENELPSRAKVRRDKELPKCRKSNTAKEDPQRAKLRSDIADPKKMKSKTDSDEPNLVLPSTDSVLLAKPAGNFMLPKTARLEPKRAKVRKDNDAPMCKNSNTEIEAPRRAKLRRDIDDP
jgi:hypothetical protein